MIKKLSFLAAALVCCFAAHSQDYYLAGQFNNWDEDSPDWKFDFVDNNYYAITFDTPEYLTAGTEFKVTNGTWDVSYGSDSDQYSANPNESYFLKGGTNGKLSADIECKKVVFTNWSNQNAIFFLTEEEANSLYIIGPASESGMWTPSAGTKLAYNSENGHYTGQITITAENKAFGFTCYLGTGVNDGENWNVTNATRFGGDANESSIYTGSNVTLNEYDGLIDNSFQLDAVPGTYNIDVDLDNRSFIITEENPTYPEELYVVGAICEDVSSQWNLEEGITLSKDAEANVYRGENISIYQEASANGYGTFALLSSDGLRYGPSEQNAELVSGTSSPIIRTNNYFKAVAPRSYDFVVDLDNNTISITDKGAGAGVETISANEMGVTAGDGEIIVNGDAAVSIYNVCGQRIAADSSERTFSVPAGIYVVVANGKAAKIAVK